ncbi:MAG: MXAN_5187 C-terminal domain-containing protein [Myxococcota bacterium]
MAKRGKEANVDVEAVVNDISRKMARLRVLYDQYFLGIEKRAPLTLQKDVVRLIRSLERVHIRQTALKFRYRSLVQKFQSYRAYWMRTTREIENGTYRRHQVRDKKRINRREKQRQHQENGVVEIDIDMEDIAELDLNDPSVLTPAAQGGGGAGSVYAPGSLEARVEVEPQQALSAAGESAAAFLEQLGMSVPTPKPNPPSKPNVPTDLRGMKREHIEQREQRLKAIKRRLGVSGGKTLQRTSSSSTPAIGSNPSSPGQPRQSRPSSNNTPPLSRPARRLGQQTLSRPTSSNTRPPSPNTPPRSNVAVPRPANGSTAPASRATTGRAGQRTIRRSGGRPSPSGRRPGGPSNDDLTNAGLNETKLKGIYQSLVDAKKRCNESTAKLSYDSVVRSIAKQTRAVKQKHKANKVDFQVVIKNGKAFLKPVPK